MDHSIQGSTALPTAGGKLKTATPDSRKFGLILLIGIVVGSMIGGGAFNLPQNMASGAGLGAVTIAWIITLVGMFFLSNTFRTLADKRPDLKAGIYRYAQEGFGPLAGFEMAWGYWLSSAFGNVAFAVLIMQMFGYFFPIFGDGKNWPSIIGGSVLIWTMHFTVLSGVKRAAGLNVFSSFVNVITLGVVLVVMALFVSRGSSPSMSGVSRSIWKHSRSGQEHDARDALGVSRDRGCGRCIRPRQGADASGHGDIRRPRRLHGPLFPALRAALRCHAPEGIGRSRTPSQPMSCRRWLAIGAPSLSTCRSSSPLCSAGSPGPSWPRNCRTRAQRGCLSQISGAREPSSRCRSLALDVEHRDANYDVRRAVRPERLDLADLDHGRDEPAALSRQHGLPLAICQQAWVPASASETRGMAIWTGILGTLYSAWLLYAAGPKFLLMSTIVFAWPAGLLVREARAGSWQACV